MNALIEQFRKQLSDIALYSDETISNYISCLYKYQSFVNIDLPSSTSTHIKQWMMKLKNDGSSSSRLTHHKSALTGFFTFLVNLNIIKNNSAEGLFPLRRNKSDLNQPIDKETACKLLKAMDRSTWINERDFMIVSFLYALGLRRGECASLKIKDFDPNFDPQHKIGLLTVHGKGRKQRALFVVDKLYDYLIAYLKIPVAKTHVKKKRHVLKSRYIFPSRYGKILTGDHILKIVHQAADNAGIKQRVTPHVLRHSFATEMYQQSASVNEVQDMLGHETEAETALYIHVPEKLKQQALENIIIEGEFSWPYLQGGTSRLLF